MTEEWIDVKEKLPEIGARVRALVVKELIYMGNQQESSTEWKYDGFGEHGIYSWSYTLKSSN